MITLHKKCFAILAITVLCCGMLPISAFAQEVVGDRKLVAADLNGTWSIAEITHGDKPLYLSQAKRVSTIVDFERLSVWTVFEEKGVEHALEFLMSDITDSCVSFELSRTVEYLTTEEINRGIYKPVYVIDRYADSTVLKFDLSSRTYSLDVAVTYDKKRRSAVTLKKLVNSVPTQAIKVAAHSRIEKMKESGIAPTVFDPRTNAWVNEFLSSLEPLAEGVLEEYGRQLASGQELRVREAGMAAAAALLRISVREKN